MPKMFRMFYLTCILFGTVVSSYEQDYICPWSRDGRTQLVFDGTRCVYPKTQEFSCPETDGHYKCPESDRKYYSCRNGVSSLESCPSDAVFDGTDACVSQSFRCPKPVGKFRYPRNAHNYYQCWYNRPHIKSCQKNQHFNGRECVEILTKRTKVVVRQQRRQQFTCPDDNGVYPDRRDPCCFWVCRDRTPTKGRCPQNACGCATRWIIVSGVIVHQDNGNQIIDTWNTQTHQWDRSYRSVAHNEQNTGQHIKDTVRDARLEIKHRNDDRVPGYPVLAENQVIEDTIIDQDDYQSDY